MRKKLLLVALLATLALGSSSPAAHVAADSAPEGEPLGVILNGSPLALKAPAVLVGGTTLVPLRGIAEALGAEVEWREDTQSAIAVKGDSRLELTLGSRNGYRDGDPVALAAAPLLMQGSFMVPLRFFSETFGTTVKWDDANRSIAIDDEEHVLPSIGTIDKLRELIASSASGTSYAVTNETMMKMPAVSTTGETVPSPVPPNASEAKAKTDYSTTNVQVEGVDEADIVKTDGEYLYQVNGERIVIAKANPANELAVAGTVSYAGQSFHPAELYVEGNTMIVVGSSDSGYSRAGSVPIAQESNKMALPRAETTAKAIIYDTTDKKSVRKVREIELKGSYVTSRKIGNSFYLITNQYFQHSIGMYEKSVGSPAAEAPGVPSYRDTVAGENFNELPFDRIRYMPDSPYANYLVIAGVRVDRPEGKADVSAYLGAGDKVYASLNNMYVTQSKFVAKPIRIMEPQQSEAVRSGSAAQPAAGLKAKALLPPAADGEQRSAVYKFLLDQGHVRIAGSGEVPGTVLNQYSMDEYYGFFRIATTKGSMWLPGEQTSKNNVYVLDESMNVTGALEDIAPGERIYSVRFMGSRAYMVTFRNVDPLFAIDLSSPQSPRILGSLKIPGYSDYLHPYDDTHLIGFGKDTTELSSGSGNGTTAFYQGMKIAMFDVSDVSHPVELFKTSIGDRGTDSELLHNPKALLFDKERNLMAFPVTVMKVPAGGSASNDVPTYGQFAFQGAYIYNVNASSGFTLKGTITHLSADDMAKSGGGWYGSGKNIDRIVSIGETLYTLSRSEIRANAMNGLSEAGRLPIPQ